MSLLQAFQLSWQTLKKGQAQTSVSSAFWELKITTTFFKYPAFQTPLRASECVWEGVLVGLPNDPSKKPFDHRFGAVLLLHGFQNQ